MITTDVKIVLKWKPGLDVGMICRAADGVVTYAKKR